MESVFQKKVDFIVAIFLAVPAAVCFFVLFFSRELLENEKVC